MTYRKMTQQRHRDLYDRFEHLYNIERRRYDDCIQILMKEFYYATDQTVVRILREERERREAENEKSIQEKKESPGH